MRFSSLASALVILPLQALATPQSDACAAFASVNLVNIMHKPTGYVPAHPHMFGDFSAVVAACKAAVQAQPGDPALTLQYARALIADTDLNQAKDVLRPLMDTKNPTAIRLYGALVFGGLGLTADPEKGADYYRRAAELGDPVAQLMLAEWLRQTDRPEREYKPWYVYAAAAGYAPAEYYLCKLSRQGKISGVSRAEQIRLLKSSAQKGFPWAMGNLAEWLRDGTLPPDPARAKALEDAVRKIQPESGLGFENYWIQFG